MFCFVFIYECSVFLNTQHKYVFFPKTQVESLEFDVNLMYENCASFNDEESDIVVAALQLKIQMNVIIRPEGANVGESENRMDGSSSSSNVVG